MFIAMAELEARCARLSAMCMTPIERRRLHNHHEGMQALVEQKDRLGYAEANQTFHCLVYDGARNAVLAEMATGLGRRLQPFRRAQFHSPSRLERSLPEHDAIVAAIVAGAQAAMLHHPSLVEDAFARFADASAA